MATLRIAFSSAVVCAASLVHSIQVDAADGTWNVDADGNWSNTSNWLNGTIADGAGFTANFNTNITTTRTITLDSNRTVGRLTFYDDSGTAVPWILSGTSSITLVGGTTPVITTTTRAEIDVVLGGSQGLIKNGPARLTLHKNNTYSGGTTIAAGTLEVGNGGTTGSISGNVTNSGVLSFNRSDTVTISGVISGTGDVGFLGTGTSILTGSSSYNGTTTIASGTVRVAHDRALGGSGVVVDGSLVIDPGVNLSVYSVLLGNSGSSSIDLSNGARITSTAGAIGWGSSGAGSVAVSGSASSWNIAGSFDVGYFGNGTLAIENGGRVTSSSTTIASQSGTAAQAEITDSGSQWQVNGTLIVGRVGDGTLNIVNGGRADVVVHTFVGNQGGTGALTVSGVGSQLTVGDDLSIRNGNLTINDGGRVTSSLGRLEGASGIGGNATISGPESRWTIHENLIVGNANVSNTLSINDGARVDAGSLQLGQGNASGVITASGNGTQLNITTSLSVGNLGKGSLNILSGAKVTSNQGFINPFVGSGTVLISGENSLWSITGNLSLGATGIGNVLTIEQGGRLEVGGVLTVTSNTPTIMVGPAGTLSIGALSGTGSIAVDGTLTTNSSNSTVFGGVISGAGGFSKSGSGTLTFTGSNTYGGGTTISGGTLQVGGGATTGSLGSGNVQNNGVLAFNRSNTLSVSNVISGSGSLVQVGTGTTRLFGVNNYAGGTTVSGGILQVDNNRALGTGGVTIEAGGRLHISPGFSISNPITFSGGTLTGASTVVSNITAAGTALQTLSLVFSGTGSFTQAGAGTTVLTANNSYSGGTTVAAGVLRASHNNALGTGGVVLLTGGQLDVSSGITITNPITFSGGTLTGVASIQANVALGGTTMQTLAVPIGGTSSLRQNGTGVSVITGNNSFNGGTTISAGTLQAAHNNALGTAGVVIQNGARLDVLDGITLANQISFAAGGTLSGNGTINGNVTVSNGATIAPGNSPGTLNFVGDQEFGPNGNYFWEINDVDAGAGVDPGWDLIDIAGQLLITATSGAKFDIDVKSLTLANASGNVHDFNPALSYDWVIAQASGGITGFDPGVFQVNTSGFNNTFNGAFSVQQSGNGLYIHYAAVPEPGSLALAAVAATGWYARYRRRRRGEAIAERENGHNG